MYVYKIRKLVGFHIILVYISLVTLLMLIYSSNFYTWIICYSK